MRCLSSTASIALWVAGRGRYCRISCAFNEGLAMKPFVSVLLLLALAAFVVMPLAEPPALAQAPTGPQGGPPSPQQQQKPTPPQTPATGQQPPQSGVSISVDVPVVTL